MSARRASLKSTIIRDVEQATREHEIADAQSPCCARCRRGTPATGLGECGYGRECACHCPDAAIASLRTIGGVYDVIAAAVFRDNPKGTR